MRHDRAGHDPRDVARRVEELGFLLKFEGALPRTIYQFIVLTVARATGAGFEWHDHIAHARAAGLPADVIDRIGTDRAAALPQPGGAGRSAGAGRRPMGQ